MQSREDMLRDALPEDYALYARLFPELDVPDSVPPLAQFVSDLMPSSYVLLDGEDAVGFALIQVLADTGYVRQVMVDAAFRGRGHGRRLMLEAAARFRRAGCTRWCLNVNPRNTPAVRLYSSLGLERQYASASLSLEWSIVDQLPRDDLAREVRDVPPEDDAAIEAALGLTRGIIAAARAVPRKVLRQAARAGRPVAFASLDPSFPGCYPFRARLPEDAQAVLAQLAAFADPRWSHVRVTFEDSPELVHSFTAAGARLVLAYEHYAGTLT